MCHWPCRSTYICVKRKRKKKSACDSRPASLSRDLIELLAIEPPRGVYFTRDRRKFRRSFVIVLYIFILAKSFFRYSSSVSVTRDIAVVLSVAASWLDCEQTITARPSLTPPPSLPLLFFTFSPSTNQKLNGRTKNENTRDESDYPPPLPSPIDR